jgi:hypothetical protein
MAAYSPRVRLSSQSSAELTVLLLRSVVEVYRVGLIKDGWPFAMCLLWLLKFCRTYCGTFVIRGRSVPHRTDQRWWPIRHVFASASKVLQTTYRAAFAIRGRSVPRRIDQRWLAIRYMFALAPKVLQTLLCCFCDPW